MTPEKKDLLLKIGERIDPFSAYNHIRITEVSEGHSRVELTVEEDSQNRWGQVHGGALFTLADVACGSALVGLRQEACVTVSSTMDFIASAGNAKRLIATGSVTRAGKRTCFCRADIATEDGTPVAQCHAVWTYTGHPLPL